MASNSYQQQKPPSRPAGLTTNTIYSQKLMAHNSPAGTTSFDAFDQAASKFNNDSKKLMNLTTDGNFAGGTAKSTTYGRNDETTKFYGSTKAGENVNLFCESIVEQA